MKEGLLEAVQHKSHHHSCDSALTCMSMVAQQGGRTVAVAMPVLCSCCARARAMLKRPKTGHSLCRECFFWAFEEEVHETIVSAGLFTQGETVAIGASGGKDSTVLAHVLKVLNDRHHYGLKLLLLSVDEGITGYRDDSLETVRRNQRQYELPLKIVSYEELYGWTMDAIVKQVGLKNNCTFCGVFRRQALDRGAMMLKVDKICTGKLLRPWSGSYYRSIVSKMLVSKPLEIVFYSIISGILLSQKWAI